MFDDQHAGAKLLVDPAKRVKKTIDDHRCEAERRFVKQQHAGPQHQRATDRQHLLLAPAQRTGLLRPALAQPGKQFVHLFHVLHDAVPVGATKRADAQVLLHREIREGAPAFGRMGNAEPGHVVGGLAPQFALIEPDAALAPDQAADGTQRGRLARAVGAKKNRDTSLLDRNRNAVQHADTTVAGHQVVNLQDFHRGLPR